MGAVYRAEDLARNRVVALKVMRSEAMTGPSAHDRLRREALACVGLNHPNITEVYEVAEADGTSFIAMDLVEGETLRGLRTRGPIPWLLLAQVGRRLAPPWAGRTDGASTTATSRPRTSW